MEKPGVKPDEAKSRRELRWGLFLTSLPWLALVAIWLLLR
jgi:hypothetical protein